MHDNENEPVRPPRLLPALRRRFVVGGRDRGDVPGWVLVTLMTAGLVLTLWAAAGPRLRDAFEGAMDQVVGGP